MLKKFQPQGRSKFGVLPVGKKANRKDYITYDGVDVNELTEIKMFHPTYTYQEDGLRDFDAIPLFLADIFKDGKLVYKFTTLMDIQVYARKEFDKLWTNKRVLNPQHYPVDLKPRTYGKIRWTSSIRCVRKFLGGEEWAYKKILLPN